MMRSLLFFALPVLSVFLSGCPCQKDWAKAGYCRMGDDVDDHRKHDAGAKPDASSPDTAPLSACPAIAGYSICGNGCCGTAYINNDSALAVGKLVKKEGEAQVYGVVSLQPKVYAKADVSVVSAWTLGCTSPCLDAVLPSPNGCANVIQVSAAAFGMPQISPYPIPNRAGSALVVCNGVEGVADPYDFVYGRYWHALSPQSLDVQAFLAGTVARIRNLSSADCQALYVTANPITSFSGQNPTLGSCNADDMVTEFTNLKSVQPTAP